MQTTDAAEHHRHLAELRGGLQLACDQVRAQRTGRVHVEATQCLLGHHRRRLELLLEHGAPVRRQRRLPVALGDDLEAGPEVSRLDVGHSCPYAMRLHQRPCLWRYAQLTCLGLLLGV